MGVSSGDIRSFLDDVVGLDLGLGLSTFHDRFHWQYVANNHVDRLARAYETVLEYVGPDSSVVIVGAEAVEGLIVSHFAPGCRLRLFSGAGACYCFEGRGRVRVVAQGGDGSEPCEGSRVLVEALDLEREVIPMQSGEADVTVALEILEHLRYHPLYLMQQLNRLTRADGVHIVSTPNLNSRNAIRRIVSLESPCFYPSFAASGSGIPHAKEYAVLELLALLLKSGFAPLCVTTFDHPSSDAFSHNEAYLSRALVHSAGGRLTCVRQAMESAWHSEVAKRVVEVAGEGALLGDYLLVVARRVSGAEQQPYHPLYDLAHQAGQRPQSSARLGTEAELLELLDSDTPPELSRDAVLSLVHHEQLRGLSVVVAGEAGDAVDLNAVANWMYHRVPAFYEPIARSRRAEYARFADAVRCAGEQDTGLHYRNPQRYRLIHRVWADVGRVEDGAGLLCWFPVPVTCAAQRDVRIVALSPSWLEPALSEDLGMVYAARACKSGDEVRVENVFDVTVLETSCKFPESEAPLHDLPREALRFLARPMGYGDTDVSGVARHIVGNSRSPCDQAHRIYMWMLSEFCFGYFSAPRQQWISHLLETGIGDCQAFSAFFVVMCQESGVPARTVTGSVLGFEAGAGRFVQRAWRHLVFNHQWAEFYLVGLGWVPVEFQPIANWRGGMSDENVVDEELRANQAALGRFYDEYCFGHLDNMHVRCSGMVSNCPPVWVAQDGQAPGEPLPSDCIRSELLMQTIGAAD